MPKKFGFKEPNLDGVPFLERALFRGGVKENQKRQPEIRFGDKTGVSILLAWPKHGTQEHRPSQKITPA